MEVVVVQLLFAAEESSSVGVMGEIALVLVVAFAAGLVMARLGLPPIIGYLIAGLAVGPFTPGWVADVHLAEQLGEVGIVLLLFGVGLHFSLKDLLAVRNIAVPGAVLQSALSTAIAIVVALAFGWSLVNGLVLGLAVSVASTIVLVRALMDRGQIETHEGRIAVGWLIVEDLFAVFVLLLLPVLAVASGIEFEGAAHADTDPLVDALLRQGDSLPFWAFRQLGGHETIPSIVAFAVVNVVLLGVFVLRYGKRMMAFALRQVDRAKSEELFTLGVVMIALAVALSAKAIFGLSDALGAFLAGVMIADSDYAESVGEDVKPLRDLFGVLFFAAVGMLLDPAAIVSDPLRVLAIFVLVAVVKPIIAGGVVLVLRQPLETALTIGPALGQIGEFSFILATSGRLLGILPDDAYQLIIAASILSIAANPLLFKIAERFEPQKTAVPAGSSGDRN